LSILHELTVFTRNTARFAAMGVGFSILPCARELTA
jgi:hypothetical protein